MRETRTVNGFHYVSADEAFPCATPDCEYMARIEGGHCFAHSHGRNPVMTFEAYRAQNSLSITEWRDALGNLSEAAIEARAKLTLKGEGD